MCLDKLKASYPDKEDCFENKTAATENGRTFRIECSNKTEQFCRIHVDGCFVIDNDSKKCDYVFVRCKNEDVYYVELKGQDIGRAYEQIVETISDHFPSPKAKNYGFIIASKVTPAFNRITAKKKEEFQKKYGVKLVIAAVTCKHRID